MKVGFVGLGAMGAPMANNLIAAGYPIFVHSRRRASAEAMLAKGAVWSEAPRELAAQCDVVLGSLPDPPTVEAVMAGGDGLLAGLRPGSCFIDLSTNSPTVVRRLFDTLADRGVDMLDAPVSGGPKGAASRKLAIWTSGSRTAFDASLPVLEAMGDQVRFLGAIGSATVAKLVHNCANYTMNIVLAEVFSLGVKAGVPPLDLFAAVRQGSLGRQSTIDRLADQFLPARFETPSFALNLAHKDVALATELARELGVPMRLANLAFAEMTEALNRGWGADDSRSPMRLQTERAGVTIQVPQEELQVLREKEPLNRG
ncbi:NAD(P)-dependent oxidoreductase [Ancylobacter sp. A5.8]|uniref:NAD(P)-dependent oxidoreductase n=1 Tax=Ancylobacter gelatini TaxID=2919920 RepID=UPI001F4D6585|nr:NAD(P)-dependent oxidoreductase [Ancylobacter gelatini]MCJ8144014.1 NAD(P)-dependent oxidoreductase [Ancylobacter gelatini]